MTFYGPQDHRCPECGTCYHGLEMRCPDCGWAPKSNPVPSSDLGDVVVSMQDPGVYESKERMPVDPDYGGEEDPLPPGGVK